MTSIPKPKRERDEKYLAWIRTQPCLVHASYPCEKLHGNAGTIDAHHVRERGKGGVGTKPSDRRTVPLCRIAHENYHSMGRPEFERGYVVDLEAEIKRLNLEYSKLHPAPKERRRPSMKVRFSVSSCERCGRNHDAMPLSRLSRKGSRLQFRCIYKNALVEVNL